MVARDDCEFEAWVDRTVAQALERPHSDFGELTASLPGIYPQEVIRALRALDGRDPMLDGVPAKLLSSAQQEIVVSSAPSGLLGLPPPHPLDFEWRFAPSAISVLTDLALSLTPRGAAVALVGTPTFAATRTTAFRRNPVDYYGLDADALQAFGLTTHLRHVRTHDLLRASVVTDRYHTVVMDPPWYDDHVQRFLYFAHQALRIDGHLLLAMPAAGTRPGISVENAQTLAWAERLGFALNDIEHGTVPYETPPFERNALRASGILNVASEWRRGDLWSLRKRTEPRIDWPGDIAHGRWKEFRSGPVRVRVDTHATDSGADPSLRPIVEGDVLSTVSRRDPRRAAVRVWTTGNRVFACDAPLKFAAMVEAWLDPNCLQDCSDDIERCAREHFFALIERERTDLAWPTG